MFKIYFFLVFSTNIVYYNNCIKNKEDNMNLGKEILNIKIDDVIPNRFQPRLTFNEDELNELTASIKQHGIIQPLVLRKIGDKYEIIAGERRFKAAVKAGLREIPAIITELDDKESAEVAVVENIQRKQLSALEEAKSYKRLLDLGQLTQDQLAIRMGKSQSNVANKLRLLNLGEDVQQALLTNKISERHARSLLQLKDFNEQSKMLNNIINDRLTVKQTDDLIKDILNAKANNNGDISLNSNNSLSNVNMSKELNTNISNNIQNSNVVIPNNDISIPNFGDNNVNNDVINLNNLNNNPTGNSNVMDMDINDNMQKALNGLDIVDAKSNVFNDTEAVIEDKTQAIDINKIKEVAEDINRPKDLPNFDDLLKSDLPKDVSNDNNTNNNLFSLNGNKFFPSLNDEFVTTNDLTSQISAKNVDNGNMFNDEIKPVNIEKIDTNSDGLSSLNVKVTESSNNSDFNNIVNEIRNTVKNASNGNNKVNVTELDLADKYQIIININKN